MRASQKWPPLLSLQHSYLVAVTPFQANYESINLDRCYLFLFQRSPEIIQSCNLCCFYFAMNHPKHVSLALSRIEFSNLNWNYVFVFFCISCCCKSVYSSPTPKLKIKVHFAKKLLVVNLLQQCYQCKNRQSDRGSILPKFLHFSDGQVFYLAETVVYFGLAKK